MLPHQSEENIEEEYDDDTGDIEYKSANIHNPKDGQLLEVTVIEDSACRVNFISPNVAKRCNLDITSTPPIESQTWMGKFTSNQGAFVTWFGKDDKPGIDWFYIAPETAPPEIQVVVGTQFTKDHPNAFKDRKLLPPALLTVAAKMKVRQKPASTSRAFKLTSSALKKDEPSQIETREAIANAQAAAIERRREQTKRKRGDKNKKPTGSSSRKPNPST